ncbi:MAG: MotA/TolQ/ExbB proton channel family protein [Opitutales bacterium]|jgi:biopolymer transport protein TolQ
MHHTIPAVGSVLSAFADSNFAGQLIVILLVAFSVVAWTVMLGKYNELKRMRNDNLRFERYLAQLASVMSAQRNVRGPYATLSREALEAYDRAAGAGSLPQTRVGLVDNALQRAVGECVMRYESKMVWLASIVTGAPFFGLLGTVWGVMDAFGAIATEKTATIQMLAPGVSGALLTTVAGLLVAIPSVFGYNYLLSQTKLMVTELENFASSLADRVEIETMDQAGRVG